MTDRGLQIGDVVEVLDGGKALSQVGVAGERGEIVESVQGQWFSVRLNGRNGLRCFTFKMIRLVDAVTQLGEVTQ